MPRKGWTSLQTPTGWFQVVRGPRPKPAPGQQQWRSSSSWWQCGGQWPALKSPTPQVRRWQRGPDTRGSNPDEVLAAARTKVSRLERAIDALGDSESPEARWLGVALQEARRAAQERPLAVQVEECQAFIERSRNRLTRLEQERVAEQKELDAALVRLTRLREEMVRVPSPGPTQPVVSPLPPDPSTAEILQLRARVAELEVEKEELRKKRARSLSVPAPDLPGALSQSIVPLQVPARDRSELMATLIENGGTVAGSSNRFSPLA